MKKTIVLLLAAVLLLSACTAPAEETPVTQMPAEETPVPSADMIAQVVVIAMGGTFEYMRKIHEAYDDATFTNYVEGYYGLASEAWDDCAIYMSENAAEAFEITVFHLTELADTNSVMECLEEYRLNRQGDFFGYNPEQAEIVENGLVVLSDDGRFAGLMICPYMGNAERIFDEAVNSAITGVGGEVSAENTPVPEVEPSPDTSTESAPEASSEPSQYPGYWLKYVDPEIDDMSLYDTAPILAAWEAGSDEGLNKKDKKLYNRCTELIAELITDEMSDYEKEWAVYQWLCANVDYDYRHYEIPNSAPRDSYRPYGALVNGTAVCLGYATAFQLLMELAGVECITVVGAAFSSREDHAWNMVRLDGEWYCADATWDAGGIKAYPENCSYFNVTSDWMARTDHQWDYENVPLATAEDGGF